MIPPNRRGPHPIHGRRVQPDRQHGSGLHRPDSGAHLANDPGARLRRPAGNPGPIATFEYRIDLIAPTITASPDAGLYKKAQSVRLSSDDPRARIFYTVGGQPPTRSSPEFKRTSRPIAVGRTAAIRALAVDPAGNQTRRTFEYRIDTRAPTVSASLQPGSYDPTTPPRVVRLRSSEGGEVYYTTDGSAPDPGGPNTTRGTGPIQLDQTKTIKVMAVDQAGNRGAVASFRYVIRQPTEVTLDLPTAELTLGSSLRISGSVSPVGAGETVEVTIFTPGTSPNMTRTLDLNDASRFGFTYKPPTAGPYSVSVSFPKDADNLGSISQLGEFRVVRFRPGRERARVRVPPAPYGRARSLRRAFNRGAEILDLVGRATDVEVDLDGGRVYARRPVCLHDRRDPSFRGLPRLGLAAL